MQLDFLFDIFNLSILDFIQSSCNSNSISFGFGGIASPLDRSLKVSPELLLYEHIALNSDCIIISRSLALKDYHYIRRSLNILRDFYSKLSLKSNYDISKFRRKLRNV